VRFQGAPTDFEDQPSELAWSWRVDLHHNNHVHPSFMVSSAQSPFFIMGLHDDGTGVFYRARLIVTDTGGARDTATVDLFPEVDLVPSAPALLSPAGADAPLRVRFGIANAGGMPSPFAQWRLYDGAVLLAQGDTLCPAHDSVIVVRTITGGLLPGWRTFRVVVDTAKAVPETDDENNDAAATALLPDHALDALPPLFVSGPTVVPFGANAVVHWTTNEWAFGSVRYGPDPVPADVVGADADTAQEVTLSGLAPATRYYFVVRAEDPHGNWAETPLDSFWTSSGPLDAPGGAPGVFALSPPFPNPSRGAVEFRLDLPAAATVGFDVHDLQGRLVWRAEDIRRDPGRWTLRWPGVTSDGMRAAPGLYHARVRVNGTNHLRRIALLR